MITPELDSAKKRLKLAVKPDVTSSNVSELKAQLDQIFADTPADEWKTLYLDLRNARLVDSMGLNWIFQVCRSLRNEDKKLVVQISSPAVQRVMTFAGLDRFTTIKYRHRKQIR